MKRHFSQAFLNLITGFSFLFLLIALAAAFVLYFRPLYYRDISRLGLNGTYGLSAGQIRENYDALIDYNSPFSYDTLQFPDLPASEEGLIHFIEVKQLFMSIFLLGLICLFLLLILLPLQRARGKLGSCLTVSALMTVLLPTVVGIGVVVRFDDAFLLFHRLFFQNDFWLFDPETDPIILLLPDTFFMHCALMILGGVVLGSVVCGLVYRKHSS